MIVVCPTKAYSRTLTIIALVKNEFLIFNHPKINSDKSMGQLKSSKEV